MDRQKTPPDGEKKGKHDSPDHHQRHPRHVAPRRPSKPEVTAPHGSEGHQTKHNSDSTPPPPPALTPAAHHAAAGAAAVHPQRLPSLLPEVKAQPTKSKQQLRRESTESQRKDLEKGVKISDVVKIPVPKVIVCRIFGVTSSESVGELMYKYFVMKLPIYLSEHWSDVNIQETIHKIRSSIEEANVKEFPVIPAATEPKEKIIDAVAKFVEVMSDPKLDSQKKKTVNPSFIRLRSLIVTSGMRVKDIENSHVYDDIPPAFKVWKESGIRMATISSTTRDAQKDYMTYTNHGDMSAFISDTISTMNPHLQTGDGKTPDFRNMCHKVLQVEPTSVLLLTAKISEAKAAQKCSMEVVLVSREERIGKKPLSDIKRDSVKDITVVKSMQAIVLVK